MPHVAWFSQLFENTSGGGVLLALPFECLADWDGTGDDYETVTQDIDQFLLHPLRHNFGLFINEDDGIHEAHWFRLPGREELYLAVWSAWPDPSRPTQPNDMKLLAKNWEQRKDPRQSWLPDQLSRTDHPWERLEPPLHVDSGVLLLLHGEGLPVKARFAKPRAIAQHGQVVPVGLAPGRYQIETVVLNELPDGEHLCLVCRWVAIGE
ncbi:hypothetical protein BH10PLA2_BH10PLA2_15200 [soil metagenome]